MGFHHVVDLEKIKFAVLAYVSKELAEEFAIAPTAKITDHLNWFSEQIVLQIRQDVFGKQVDIVEIRYPADWWQAFKERWFPKWLLKRYPVIETIETIDIKALYPTINIPNHRAIINVWETEERSQYDESTE
jgi:hypothetical protein